MLPDDAEDLALVADDDRRDGDAARERRALSERASTLELQKRAARACGSAVHALEPQHWATLELPRRRARR